ncbi:hypothetical protein P171DRAFT_500348 [Karstenula rhodostoma CBS 690.94]|uniref:Uncharacterized protein n=1 Tax=Karstenula rhodostoma CBS 690.94 TaxID=1392251 RepID=A0A9P4U814_9PLEO|nr:hypothetical protein P171DRAFT_500348 [Karstenula rhodostoma CBS 690.94]
MTICLQIWPEASGAKMVRPRLAVEAPAKIFTCLDAEARGALIRLESPPTAAESASNPTEPGHYQQRFPRMHAFRTQVDTPAAQAASSLRSARSLIFEIWLARVRRRQLGSGWPPRVALRTLVCCATLLDASWHTGDKFIISFDKTNEKNELIYACLRYPIKKAVTNPQKIHNRKK